MKSVVKIICCVMFTILLIGICFVIYAQASRLNQAEQEIANRNRYLAVLVNNHDYSEEFINQVANVSGFDGYDDMVSYLVSKGELHHIPAFTCGSVNYAETYALKDTVVYCDAVEMGVIPAN